MLLSQLELGHSFVLADGDRKTVYHKVGQHPLGACLAENTRTGTQGWLSGRKTVVEVPAAASTEEETP